MKCKISYLPSNTTMRCTITFSQVLNLVDPENLKNYFKEEELRNFILFPDKYLKASWTYFKLLNTKDSISSCFLLKISIRLPIILKRVRMSDILTLNNLDIFEIRTYKITEKQISEVLYSPDVKSEEILLSKLFISTEEQIMSNFLDNEFLTRYILHQTSYLSLSKTLEPLYYTLLVAGKIKLPWE